MFKVKNPADVRTIIAATDPVCFQDDYTVIILKVWFEELEIPVPTVATPFDCERHCKELWIRAMAGEYGPIRVLPYALNGGMPTLVLDPVDPERPPALLLTYPAGKLPPLAVEAMKQLNVLPPQLQRRLTHASHG